MIRKLNSNRYGVEEYVCSTPDEVGQLPVNLTSGSTCLVITTGEVFMFNEGDSSWYSLTTPGTKVKPTQV